MRAMQGLRPVRSARHEVTSFGVVGVLATCVDVGLFNVFHAGLGIGPLTAKTLSTAVATLVSYGGSRTWTFAHRSERPVRSELPRFVAMTLVGLLISLAVLGAVRYGLGQTSLLALNVAANVVGLGLAMVWRFWAYRRWVFTGAAVRDDGEGDRLWRRAG